MCSCGSEKTGEAKAYAVNVMTMMLDAGEHIGWVACQVGHSSFKMIYFPQFFSNLRLSQ